MMDTVINSPSTVSDGTTITAAQWTTLLARITSIALTSYPLLLVLVIQVQVILLKHILH